MFVQCLDDERTAMHDSFRRQGTGQTSMHLNYTRKNVDNLFMVDNSIENVMLPTLNNVLLPTWLVPGCQQCCSYLISILFQRCLTITTGTTCQQGRTTMLSIQNIIAQFIHVSPCPSTMNNAVILSTLNNILFERERTILSVEQQLLSHDNSIAAILFSEQCCNNLFNFWLCICSSLDERTAGGESGCGS